MQDAAPTDPIQALRERLKSDPSDRGALTALIRVLAGSSDTEELTSLVEKAVRLDPGDVHVANAVLVAASKSGTVLNDAVSLYESHAKGSVMAKVNLANLLSLKGDDTTTRDRMRNLVEEALCADPGCYEAHLAAHSVYGAQGELLKSLEHLEEAVGLAPAGDPKLPTLILALGTRLAEAGKNQDAIRLLHEAVRAYGGSPTVGSSVTHIAYTTIGMVLLSEGNTKAALQAFARSRSVSVDAVIKSSGLRTELATKLAAEAYEQETTQFLQLAETVKEMPIGTWLGTKASAGYLAHIYRAAALPIMTFLIGVLGWFIAIWLQRAGLAVVTWRFAVGFILFGYGFLVLRGALSPRLAMTRDQRWGYLLAGLGFGVGGGLWALVGWVQGLVALAILVVWGIITLAKGQASVGGRRRVR